MTYRVTSNKRAEGQILKEHGSTGRLTTHVLDVSTGKPAAGMRIDLYLIADGQPGHIMSVHTNHDGRCDSPLLAGEALKPGEYELRFHAGAYLESTGVKSKGRRFLDVIPIRFGIADASEHFHVPLLVAPFSYSTYRGS
jgi:5-hydroxyisourate hydrolase